MESEEWRYGKLHSPHCTLYNKKRLCLFCKRQRRIDPLRYHSCSALRQHSCARYRAQIGAAYLARVLPITDLWLSGGSFSATFRNKNLEIHIQYSGGFDYSIRGEISRRQLKNKLWEAPLFGARLKGDMPIFCTAASHQTAAL